MQGNETIAVFLCRLAQTIFMCSGVCQQGVPQNLTRIKPRIVAVKIDRAHLLICICPLYNIRFQVRTCIQEVWH